MKNAINWFELPVEDLARAQKFYETVLGTKLKAETFGAMPMALFSYSEGVGGALIRDARYKPAPDGALVYLDAGASLEACVKRVEPAGGKVVLPRTDIGDPGCIAVFLDTEGNRVGLHERRR